MSEWLIYALHEHGSHDYKYVGLTTMLMHKRLSAHVASAHSPNAKDSEVRQWIRRVYESGGTVASTILETYTGGDRNVFAFKECMWIAALREAGYLLTNSTRGGYGVVGYTFDDTVRQRMSEAHSGSKNYWYGKTLSKEHREKLSKARLGIEPWNKGKERPEISGTNHWTYGRTFAPEDHPMYGKTHTEEAKRKIGEANRLRAHERWHVARGKPNPTCIHCKEERLNNDTTN